MLFDPTSASHLKPWLLRTLEPICDAEPGALAEYILALLKHNVPEAEMRKELAVQLEEFLEKECSPFIDTLFTVLRTKSYLPYGTSPGPPPTGTSAQDTGIPIPLDALLSPPIPTSPKRGVKRNMDSDERDGRPPAKGARLNPDGQFARYPRDGAHHSRSTGGWVENHDQTERGGVNGFKDYHGRPGGGGAGMNGAVHMGPVNGRPQQPYRPPDQKRGICRDYHNNGYCARGAYCKFSHGDDAVVPGQLFPTALSNPMPFLPMFPGAMPFAMGSPAGVAYDPHEARMDMRPQPGGMHGGRPQQRAPLLPRIQKEDGTQIVHHGDTSGELPVIQDLTPAVPADETTSSGAVQAGSEDNNSVYSSNNVAVPPIARPMNGMMNGNLNGAMSGSMNAFVNPAMEVDTPRPVDYSRPARGGFHGAPRGGRAAGSFGGEVHSFRPERRNDKTLVVEKIPEDKLSLDAVNGWFKRFGTVTNVAIDVASAKALVSFSNHEEAHAAWKSEDAVFNNRFVKIFWHRPMEGHGQVGARMLAASAPLVASISTPKAPETAPPSNVSAPAKSATPSGRKASVASAAVSSLAEKQKRLESQIAEQKTLMARLGTAGADEKKEIMARLRSLGEEMKPTSSAPTSSLASTSTSAPARTASPSTSTSHATDLERKMREKLDKELELHNASLAQEEVAQSTEDLKAKLEKLKAEAASLGLPEANTETYHAPSYRPYRGRGRGNSRTFYRGAPRGGPPRTSMKLDNRPKRLFIKGVPPDGTQAVRDWYETTGQMESVETVDNNDIIVTFRTRSGAEQALSKGNNIPTTGQVKISWYSGPHSHSESTTMSEEVPPKTMSLQQKPLKDERERSVNLELPSLHVQDEEPVASGWGMEDDEDGMGML